MLARLACVVLAGGCYSLPQPACGFICGDGGACPDGYTCNALDNRCHLGGAAGACAGLPDGSVSHGIQLIPPDRSTDVAVDQLIEVEFDSPITRTDPAGFVVTANAMPVAGFTDAPLGGLTADFRLHDQLPPNATIEVTMSAMISASDAHGGVTWRFETGPDLVGPRVVDQMPPGTLNVSPQTPIWVRFDEAAIGVDATTVTLNEGMTEIPATVSYDPAMHVAMLVPDAPLASDTSYGILVGTSIRDVYGNASFGFFSQFVTTSLTPVPEVMSTSPVNGATNVDVGSAVAIVFNENVFIDANTFVLDHGITGTVVTTATSATFTPSAPLPAATTITATLSTAYDLDDNPLALPVVFSFTTR
jgi:hypothetical protein